MAEEYKFKITLSKFLWVAAEVAIAGAIVYLTDNNLFFTMIPVLEALRNYLKHRNK